MAVFAASVFKEYGWMLPIAKIYRKCTIPRRFQQINSLAMRVILPVQWQFICIHNNFPVGSRVFVDSNRYGWISSHTSHRCHIDIELMILRA